MNPCLKDQKLLLLHDGEGTSAERSHLAECEACAKRYRQLRSDLEAITRTLREEPPPRTVSHPFRPFTARWLPTAVAVALALILMWQGARIWGPSAPAPLSDEIWIVLEEFSPDFFLQNQASAEGLWTVVADAYDRALALEADRPCEWYDMPARGEVESVDAGFGDFGVPVSACVELNRS